MLEFNHEIFKAYDIRGIYFKDFNDDFAYYLGRAYVKWLNIESAKVFIAGDMRISTPKLRDTLIRGLVSAGAEVLDGGTLSTPTFYFGVSETKADGGIMISASHNPKEWNGFKITKDKAKPVSLENGLGDILELINNDDDKIFESGSVLEVGDILAKSIFYDMSKVDIAKIKEFKIVADTSNGMGAQYLEALFAVLPGEYAKLNFSLDGSFPAHEADPLKEKNLVQLKEAVLDTGADFGIATDGDGDRIFLVDDMGQTVSPALLRGLLAKIYLQEKPGSKIAYDIRPGKITEDLILENGGVPIVTRVGHSLIKDQMLKEGAYFAGESSGHFFLNDEVIGCFERPILMILELLKEFSKIDGKLSDYLKQYDRYFHSGEINSSVDDKTKVFTDLENKYSDADISRLDGLTVKYEDYWFNVRASNTENKIRLNLEATSKGLMEEKRDEVLKIINS